MLSEQVVPRRSLDLAELKNIFQTHNLLHEFSLDPLLSKVTSPLTEVGIVTNPSYPDETHECQKLFITDLLNISIQLIHLSTIFTNLTIYGHNNVATFDDGANSHLCNQIRYSLGLKA